jgi:BirA family biotin operon repressor/biotin-[acetyl-CoA-carboxylase] ligase
VQSFHYGSVDSTNEEAKRLIRAGKIIGPAFVLADEQTAGKGQFGRTWRSPSGAGIYLSVVDLPNAPLIAGISLLTLGAGVACIESLQRHIGIDVRLKPINDLFIADCKLGGILIETILRTDRLEAIIAGVGINLRRAHRQVDASAAQPISLEEVLDPERFEKLDVNVLVADLVVSVRQWIRPILGGELRLLRRQWEAFHLPGTALPPALSGDLYGDARPEIAGP